MAAKTLLACVTAERMGSPCSAQLLGVEKNREGGKAAALQGREKAELKLAPGAGGGLKNQTFVKF